MILAFFGVVAVWAVSKCTAQKNNFNYKNRLATDDPDEERPIKKDSIKISPQNPATPTENPVTITPKSGTLPPPPPPSGEKVLPKTPGQLNAPSAKTTLTNAPATSTSTASYTTLYVTIEGLKLRKSPGLHSDLMDKLKLYEPVLFLNKKSEKQEEISLGSEKVTDYWFKVRTKSGKEGWVFGAGVAFYKTKRKGVVE